MPERLGELTTGVCRMSNFIAPGKYSWTERKAFDLRFLGNPERAEVSRVKPLTNYQWRDGDGDHGDDYLELRLQLGDFVIVVGNLPMQLLVPQQDFAVHGFGVGVLSSDGIAERRKYLIEDGPAPSYAYLCRETNGSLVALNSHEYGIEQIFIRTHSDDARPWWEVTVSSYERIVDIVKYRVDMLGAVEMTLCGSGESGFSTQESRRKLEKGYVHVDRDGALAKARDVDTRRRDFDVTGH